MKLSSRIGVSMFMAPCQTTPVHRMARLFGQSLSSPNTPLISLACSYHAELLSETVLCYVATYTQSKMSYVWSQGIWK